MVHVRVSEDGDVLGYLVLTPRVGGTAVDFRGASPWHIEEGVPFDHTSRALGARLARGRVERLRFEVIDKSAPVATIARSDEDGAPIWTWKANGASNVASDLNTAIQDVLVRIAISVGLVSARPALRAG
jgi:hypothetical protein